MSGMRLSEPAEYAMRALVELAAAGNVLVPAHQLAQTQAIPGNVLEIVMTELRRAGLVRSQRGPDGGYCLTRRAADISLADVVNAISAL